MVKFCPSCGIKLEQEFNFCPSCGFDLREVPDSEKLEEHDKISAPEEIIICDNCGEENKTGNDICTYCGAKFKVAKTEKVIKSTVPAHDNIKKPKQKYSISKKSGTKVAKPGKAKELDTQKLLIILGGVVVIILVILFAAGVFNRAITETLDQNQGTTNQAPSVDLNNLQRINELEAQIKKNPDDKSAILELAHLRNDSGMYEKAIADYQKYLDKVPSDADARIDMGVCYYNLRNYDEAIKQMEKALKYSPKHQIGYLNLGIVNLAAGNLEKSKEWLQKAVQLDPNTEVGKKAEELLKSHNQQNRSN
jgi:uncharacterized membrane protein YvbJ